MIIEELQLKDFRCFYGESRLKFATGSNKNVTMIYAENGVGKTTLLNAILWCFYGTTTGRFEKKEEILNFDAKKQGKTQAQVGVIFEHKGQRYRAARFWSKSRSEQADFIVGRIDQHGSQRPIEPPETFIESVIPRGMAPHFLFDGEHAEAFLGEKNRGSIKDAVRDILGCTLIETAISDLSYISRKLQSRIAATIQDDKVEKWENESKRLDVEIQTLKTDISTQEKAKRLYTNQVEDIYKKLRNTEAAKQHQKRRDEYEEDLEKLKRRKQDLVDEKYRWLGSKGRFIVSKGISSETFGFLDKMESKGRIPSPYNEEFVKDILDLGECICGNKLCKNTPEYERVLKLLSKGASQVMRDRITRVRGRVSSLKEGRAKSPLELERIDRRLFEVEEEIEIKEGKLGDVSRKLKGVNIEDISLKESRRIELTRRISQADKMLGELMYEKKIREDRIRNIEKEIVKVASANTQAQILVVKKRICDSICEYMKTNLEDEEQKARSHLHSRISRILDKTSRKTLKLRMNEEYMIELLNRDDMPLPLSSGENQLLGLAFTAALVEFAKHREQRTDNFMLPGTVAPLVLDSPFGQLDLAYRKSTAMFVPEMARQVVLLVSNTQGAPEVLNALKDHLGAEYLLIRHNLDSPGEKPQETKTIHGKEHELIVYDSKFDGTEIKEVTKL